MRTRNLAWLIGLHSLTLILQAMYEIEITSPLLSTEKQKFRRWTWENRASNQIRRYEIRRENITPQTHPLAIELFAGDAPMAAILCELGWKPNNIWCVDQFRTPTPLVQDVNWKYIHLELLGLALSTSKTAETIPEGIQIFRGRFNLVICLYGLNDLKLMQLVSEYFLAPNGYLMIL